MSLGLYRVFIPAKRKPSKLVCLVWNELNSGYFSLKSLTECTHSLVGVHVHGSSRFNDNNVHRIR